MRTGVSAHLGELSVTSLKARGVAGCVLDGGCRDIRFILDEGFPVFSRFVTPEDSTWRWELEATQVPLTIGRVRIEPGDWIVGDDDGVVVVPHAIAESVLVEAETKAATENEIRAAVRDGMPPLEAYEQYGTSDPKSPVSETSQRRVTRVTRVRDESETRA